MDNFATDDAPGIGTWQTGGKATVFQNGITVFPTLFHQVGFPAPLTADHLVITFPDVGIFGIQIGPALRPLQNNLIVVIMDIAQRIDGTYWLRLAFSLLLMKLYFVGLQAAVTLCDIHVAGKHRVIGIIPFCVVGIDGDG